VSFLVALKAIHVLAAIVAVGSSVASVYWLRRAGLDRDRLVWVLDGTRQVERRIANPAYVLLLVTGILMVSTGAFRFDQGWIATAIALYVFIALFGLLVFAPAVRRQRAEAAVDPTSARYAGLARRTRLYSALTTGIVVVIVLLMVTKPF
jgi:uncharacterized membrane protein